MSIWKGRFNNGFSCMRVWAFLYPTYYQYLQDLNSYLVVSPPKINQRKYRSPLAKIFSSLSKQHSAFSSSWWLTHLIEKGRGTSVGVGVGKGKGPESQYWVREGTCTWELVRKRGNRETTREGEEEDKERERGKPKRKKWVARWCELCGEKDQV